MEHCTHSHYLSLEPVRWLAIVKCSPETVKAAVLIHCFIKDGLTLISTELSAEDIVKLE